MVLTNYAKQAVAWGIGSDITNNYIQYCAIGSGSGAVLATDTTMVAETQRNTLTGSPNFTEVRKVGFQADFNSVEMSGTTLFEFGFLASGPALGGSIWQREGFGSIVFDGTSELQIVSTMEVL